ncbi:putative PPE family protein PPE29 [Mycobacterium simulans]|uniref:Putative PPE family protein PPE29 n=1 Tax=Mycobacterium simulans TaxID=627089 RepID=A0A7Z7NBD5_9MYCO|nr:PPE family protein [Mycobacterium simulans]SOJ56673.1 putative PPE family protein PPE29 [Mycobacterium simulans]SON61136.1 putative PPE family protein PPE29 [Mycobacterium simulans]
MLFAALPPEVNSARMYTGPGAGSMLSAATAWDALAADLNSTAVSVESMLSGLISVAWLGPAATTMAAAAAPYVTWLHATAAQAEQAAGQAKAGAAAYEAAYAMTVPPALIAANRAQLMALVATNFLGQNSPAIAATEAQYGEMWAQDAAAMYSYAASSAAATTMTPFTEPPQAASPVGLASQAQAVAQAAGNSVATDIITALSQLTSAVPSALAGIVVNPVTSTVLPEWVTDLQTVMSIFGTPFFASTAVAGLGMSMMSTIKGLFPAAAAIGSQIATSAGQAVTSAVGAPATLAGAVTAGLGKAATVGALSVPKAWASAAPAISDAAAAPLPGTAVGAAVDALGGQNSGGLLGGMPLAHMGARGLTTSESRLELRPLRVLPEAIA